MIDAPSKIIFLIVYLLEMEHLKRFVEMQMHRSQQVIINNSAVILQCHVIDKMLC